MQTSSPSASDALLKSWQHAVEAVTVILTAFLMLWLLPKLMPSSDLMTHLTARGQAALVGSYYPPAQRDSVTVVLIDDDALASTAHGWPVPYATHARWLSNLGSVYQPRAVFLDVTFTQARKDDTLPQLVSALCRLRDQGVPVFLAALPSAETGQLAVREGLSSPPGEKPCFTLVGVNYQPHQVDRLVWSYPLWTVNQGAGSVAAEARSSALAMAQDVAGLVVPRSEVPMALTWGVMNTTIERFGDWCRYAGSLAAEMTPPRLRAVFADDEVFKPICPYTQSLNLSTLRPQSEEDEARLHRAIDGKFVMLGAAISGMNDTVTSPVHGAIPGVFMHAMALDNLLTYNGHYKRALEWEMPPEWSLFWMGIIVVLAAHLLRVLVWERLKKWLQERRTSQAQSRPQTRYFLYSTSELAELEKETPVKKQHRPGFVRLLSLKVFRLVLLILFRLVRIFITAVLIMWMVLLVQKWSDIGTLPIVDLALMALVAEWLGWSNAVLHIFPWRSHTTSSQEK